MSLDSRLVNLAAAGRTLVERGLARGASGSVSLRWEELCYISPAGVRLDRLSAADFVPLSIQRSNTWQLQRAAVDHAVHLACYRARPDAATVLMVQPPNCVALGCAGLAIPAITPDFYLAIGVQAPLLPYLPPGSEELADGVAGLIADYDAVLLRNNGLALVAGSTESALAKASLVDEAARIVLLAYAASGECSTLSPEEIEALEVAAGRYRRRRETQQEPLP